uniref:Uncharacterized protein n=1 Tax=Babesia bovis TaxID=5865 RepID=A7ARR8_BABBO|eukprot:XP_001610805.1 hypothetical protein [Babesia bovis T2Bo]
MSSPLCRLGILSYQSICCRSFSYWPPPSSKRSRIIEVGINSDVASWMHFANSFYCRMITIQLPSGKKFFVFRGKRDADGKLEPVVCFIDRLVVV